MADVKVTVERIHDVLAHPNADKLEIAVISGEGGYQCCVQKGIFKPGDKCVYFPVDSVLPEPVESKIFGEDAKVKLSKSRVKTIRLRGAISQGLTVPLYLFAEYNYPIGYDLTERLGVKKFEPDQKGSPTFGQRAPKKNQNPNFNKYTDIQHLKRYSQALVDRYVLAFEKIHGTNFRAGYVPSVCHSWLDRLRKVMGIFPNWEFVYGSHNVQLHRKNRGKDFYSREENVDVYTKTVEQYHIKDRLYPSEVIYGEIYGDKIQKKYEYGCLPGETKLLVFDVQINGKFLDADDLIVWCEDRGFNHPPIVYRGMFDMHKLDDAVGGKSLIDDDCIKEGLVVRPMVESFGHMGRLVFKYINPEYLLQKDLSEYH